MILLNDDEIDAIGCTYERCGVTKHNTDAHKLAKAQLKKVVGWILENGYEDCDGAGDSTWVLGLDKLEALLDEDQALLKEIK